MKRAFACADDDHQPSPGRRSASQTSASSRPVDHGLSPEQSQILARRLQCDLKDVVVETLGYIFNSRASRGCSLSCSDVVELWDSLHESHKNRDPNTLEARYLILGANPRYPKHVTVSTNQLSQVTRAICNFIKQRQPSFSFTTLSLRLNCDKPPHRDMRNGPGLSFIQLLEPVEGGGIWIADPNGAVTREVHGQRVRGNNIECFQVPLLLDARRKLHATEPWIGNRRLLLTAWSVLNVSNNPELVTLLQDEYGFPVSCPTLAPQPSQQSLRTALQNSVQNASRSALTLQGNTIVQDVNSQDAPETVDSREVQSPPRRWDAP